MRTAPAAVAVSITRALSASIRPRERDPALRRRPRHHVLARLLRSVERDAADRRLRLLLDAVLRRARAVPVRQQEARLLDQALELVVAVHRPGALVAELLRLGVQGRLHLTQELVDVFGGPGQRHAEL